MTFVYPYYYSQNVLVCGCDNTHLYKSWVIIARSNKLPHAPSHATKSHMHLSDKHYSWQKISKFTWSCPPDDSASLLWIVWCLLKAFLVSNLSLHTSHPYRPVWVIITWSCMLDFVVKPRLQISHTCSSPLWWRRSCCSSSSGVEK